MKALILGTGSIGSRHMRNLSVLVPGLRFVAARRGGAGNAVTEKFNARVHPSLAAALEENPDFAIVATPSALHAQALSVLCGAGVPFYVEKPVAVAAEGLEALAARAAASGLVTFAGCNLRFLPSLQRLRELSAGCGRIVRAHLECGHWLPSWHEGTDYRESYSARRELGGGVLFDLIHETDMARWLFGDFSQAAAFTGRFSGLEMDVEDAAALLFSRPGGPLVSVGLDYVSRAPLRQYRLVGTEGTIEWDLPSRRLRACDPGGRWRDIETSPEDFDVAGTYVSAMRHFLDCVKGRRQTSQPLAEGIASVKLLLKAAGASCQEAVA